MACGANALVFDFTIDRNTGLPHFTYGKDYTNPANIVLTDPGGWNQDGFVKYPHVEDTLSSVRLGAERSFADGWVKSVEFGVNYADREKTRASGLEAFMRLKNGPTTAIPGSALNSPVDLSFTGIPGSISYDIDAVQGLYNFVELVHPDVRNKTGRSMKS